MNLETLLVAGLVIAIVGGAGAALAVMVLTDRLKRQPMPPETQDDFTAAILKWGDMQDRARK